MQAQIIHRTIRAGEWLHVVCTRPDGRLYIRTTRRSSKPQMAYVVECHYPQHLSRYDYAFLNHEHAAAWYRQIA